MLDECYVTYVVCPIMVWNVVLKSKLRFTCIIMYMINKAKQMNTSKVEQ